MKKLTLFLYLSFAFIFVGCDGDEPFFGDGIFNETTDTPYVAIQDLNEDLEGITANNFWTFALTSEEDGSQVRINYSTQDRNIVSHDIIVGFDGEDIGFSDSRCRFRVTRSDAVVQTITEFPVELVITKQDVANALGVSVEELESEGRVYFGGISRDIDGYTFDLANDGVEFINEEDENDPRNGDDSVIFEEFLSCERHAYFYVWTFD